MNNEKINSKIKLSNNSSFVMLIFVIYKGGGQNLERRNVNDQYFGLSKLRILK